MSVANICQYTLLASERSANGNEKDAHFLKCGGMLSRCLGLHPILKRPLSIIINDVTSILDGKRGLLSCLTMLSAQWPTYCQQCSVAI